MVAPWQNTIGKSKYFAAYNRILTTYVIIIIYLEATHDVFTSLQQSTDSEQVETRLENVCVLSEVCVYEWTLVSLMCPLCWCFVFVSLLVVWIRTWRVPLTIRLFSGIAFGKKNRVSCSKLSKRTSKW